MRSAEPGSPSPGITTTITTTTESRSTTAGTTTPTTTAAPATATATSRSIRRHRVLVAALALAATLAACGGGGEGDEESEPPAPTNPGAFSWLDPAGVPKGWSIRRLPSWQATLAYPRGWKLTRTDPGTVTASRISGGQIVGYLNITPQQGEETLGDWAAFRPAHNQEEGDRDLVALASATGLRFRDGSGSCVKDHYATETGHHYMEIACIVRGRSATTVIVGAAPPSVWGRYAPAIERSISSFEVS